MKSLQPGRAVPPERTPPQIPAALSGHKIAAVSISPPLPLAPAFNASWDTKPRVHFDATIVRVSTTPARGRGSGDRMLGFEGPRACSSGTIRSHSNVLRVLSNIDFHYGRCWPWIRVVGSRRQDLGQPCWKLLGAFQTSARLCLIGDAARSDAQAEAAERYSRRLPAVKLRFHRGDWRDDVRALEAVRARVGGKLELLVDCTRGGRLRGTPKPPGASRMHSPWRGSWNG